WAQLLFLFGHRRCSHRRIDIFDRSRGRRPEAPSPGPGTFGASTRPTGDGTCRASWRTVIGARGLGAGPGPRPTFGHAARIRSSRGTSPAPPSGATGQSRVTTRGHSGRTLSLLRGAGRGQSFPGTPTEITCRTPLREPGHR